MPNALHLFFREHVQIYFGIEREELLFGNTKFLIYKENKL